MPRGKSDPARFQDAYIYRLVIEESDEVYIGSSCTPPVTRFSQHRHAAMNPDTQLQSAACVLFHMGTVQMLIVEQYPCANAQELTLRERWWIENTPNCINKNIPGQTWQERRAKRQDAHDAYMKEFRNQKYTCECGKTISRAEKARHERTAFHLRLYDPVATTQDS